MSAPSLARQLLAHLSRAGASPNRLILRAAAVVGLGTLAVKLVAAAKESALAAAFGVGDAADALVIALMLPAFAVALIANSCNGALIPAYIATREGEGPAAAQRLLSQTSLVSLGLFALVAAVLGLAGPMALPWLAPGFDEAKLTLARQLLYLSLPQVVLSGLATVWQAVLNARERFALGALAPAAVPAVAILTLLAVRGPLAIYALVGAMSAGYLVQLAALGAALRRQGVGLLPRWHGGGPALRGVLGQYWPLVAGGLLVYTTPIVDRALAASLAPGSVAALSYAYKIAALIIGVTTTALSTALIPYLARMVARGEWGGVRHALRSYTWLILAATVPLSLALALGSELIVRVVYERGAFGAEDTALVARVQAMYMLQLPFYTLHILFVRLISALRANRVLLWGTLINLVLNVAFDLVLLRLIGLPGIALANTAVYAAKLAFVAAAGLWLLRRAEEAARQ